MSKIEKDFEYFRAVDNVETLGKISCELFSWLEESKENISFFSEWIQNNGILWAHTKSPGLATIIEIACLKKIEEIVGIIIYCLSDRNIPEFVTSIAIHRVRLLDVQSRSITDLLGGLILNKIREWLRVGQSGYLYYAGPSLVKFGSGLFLSEISNYIDNCKDVNFVSSILIGYLNNKYPLYYNNEPVILNAVLSRIDKTNTAIDSRNSYLIGNLIAVLGNICSAVDLRKVLKIIFSHFLIPYGFSDAGAIEAGKRLIIDFDRVHIFLTLEELFPKEKDQILRFRRLL